MEKEEDPYRYRKPVARVPGADRLMALLEQKTGVTVNRWLVAIWASLGSVLVALFLWLAMAVLIAIVVVARKLLPDTMASVRLIFAAAVPFALVSFFVCRRQMVAKMLEPIEFPDRALREAYEPRLNRLEHRLTDGLRQLAEMNAAPWPDAVVAERGVRLAASFEERIAYVRTLLSAMEADVRAYQAASGNRDFEWEMLDERIKRLEEHLAALESLYLFMERNTLAMQVADLVGCLETQAANLPPLPLRIGPQAATISEPGTEEAASDDAIETRADPEGLKRAG